jgi:ribose transport system permease protein
MTTPTDHGADDMPKTVELAAGAPRPDTASFENRTRRLTASDWVLKILVSYGALIVLAAIVVVFGALRPEAFFSANNIQNLFLQAAPGGVVALALTLTMIIGEFDLSIGYMASLAGVVVFQAMTEWGTGFLEAVAISLAIALVMGAVSGAVVAKLEINAFVGTLGVGLLAVGLNYEIGGGSTVSGSVPSIVSTIGLGKSAGVANLTLIWLVIALLLWTLTERTRAGVHLRAVGGNSRAARLTGLHVPRLRWTAFMGSALLAATGGIMLATRLGSGEPTGGDGYMLDAFAAAFIGRGFYRPGEFNVPGTVVGALILQTGYTGLAILGQPTSYRYFFSGLIIIVALGIGSLAKKLQSTGR